MKNWIKPEAIIQQFVANDYVAACETHVIIHCDFMADQVGEGKTYSVLHYCGNLAGNDVRINYYPCDEIHVFAENSGRLQEVTFTKYWDKSKGPYGSDCGTHIGKPYAYDLPMPVTGYGWVILNEDGSYNDMHMSTLPIMETTNS